MAKDSFQLNSTIFNLEMLGKQILEELKMIRIDMKDEVRRLGSEIIKLQNQKSVASSKALQNCDPVNQDRSSYLQPCPTKDNNANIITKSTQTDTNPTISTAPAEFSSSFAITVKEEMMNPANSAFYGDVNADDEKIISSNQKCIEQPLNASHMQLTSSNTREVAVDSNSKHNFNFLLSTGTKLNTTAAESARLDKVENTSLFEETKTSALAQPYDDDDVILQSNQEPLKSAFPEENFRCRYCGKSFLHMSSYKRHLRIHTGEKPFSCAICHKKFSLKGNLNKHEMIHKNERPFVCIICNRGFVQKSSLKTHILSHQKVEKLFQCDECDKSFKLLTHLTAHKLVHSM